jgi:hypothetical protein
MDLGGTKMIDRIRSSAAVCTLLASTALCVTPARAQVAAPPVQQSVDSNGVDMALGIYNFSAPSLSIGPSGPQGLVFSRELRGNGWRDSLTCNLVGIW